MWYLNQIKTHVIAILAFSVFSLAPTFAVSAQEHEVDELAHGVALYNFYQGKYFSSITDVLVAKKTQTIIDENKKAELLMGRSYLSYGMRDDAHEIFENIIINSRKDAQIPYSVLHQVLFHIGKDYYINGFDEKAMQVLLSIGDNYRLTLKPEYESERLNILAEIYMHDYQFTDVMQALELFPKESIWKRYTEFNLGINLIKNDRPDEGVSFLKGIAELQSSVKELDMLHDQANLALAVNYSKSGQSDLATKYFENIKLGNIQSSSALLGLGWVQYQSLSYRYAISTWLELTRRSKSDSYVQEALMLIPSVLEKRGEKFRALTEYNFAASTYMQQLKNVEKVKLLIKQGEVTRVLKSSANKEGLLDSDDMTKTMGPDLSEYLSEMIVSKDFGQAVNGYRDLTVLRNTLSQRLQTIPSLKLVLDEKINTYNSSLSNIKNSRIFDDAKKLQGRRSEFIRQLEESLASNSKSFLLNKQEKKLFSILNRVKAGLARMDSNSSDIIDSKYRFLSGLMEWNISTDYAPRLWAVKTSIAELDNALQGVQRTIQSITSTFEAAPASHLRFRGKIKGKKERINSLLLRIDQLLSVQEQKIQIMAETAINQYRDTLKQYHDRALFAHARLYDSMVPKN